MYKVFIAAEQLSIEGCKDILLEWFDQHFRDFLSWLSNTYLVNSKLMRAFHEFRKTRRINLVRMQWLSQSVRNFIADRAKNSPDETISSCARTLVSRIEGVRLTVDIMDSAVHNYFTTNQDKKDQLVEHIAKWMASQGASVVESTEFVNTLLNSELGLASTRTYNMYHSDKDFPPGVAFFTGLFVMALGVVSPGLLSVLAPLLGNLLEALGEDYTRFKSNLSKYLSNLTQLRSDLTRSLTERLRTINASDLKEAVQVALSSAEFLESAKEDLEELGTSIQELASRIKEAGGAVLSEEEAVSSMAKDMSEAIRKDVQELSNKLEQFNRKFSGYKRNLVAAFSSAMILDELGKLLKSISCNKPQEILKILRGESSKAGFVIALIRYASGSVSEWFNRCLAAISVGVPLPDLSVEGLDKLVLISRSELEAKISEILSRAKEIYKDVLGNQDQSIPFKIAGSEFIGLLKENPGMAEYLRDQELEFDLVQCLARCKLLSLFKELGIFSHSSEVANFVRAVNSSVKSLLSVQDMISAGRKVLGLEQQ